MISTEAKAHLSKDPRLKKLLDTLDVQIPVTDQDVYFYLIRSIVFQQLSGKAASTIFGRFLELFPDGYPYPDDILALDIPELRAVGLSKQKASYIQNVAEFFKIHQLEKKDWNALSDEEIITFLTQIKGVGKWTVQMILMTTLQRADVFPTNDLGIQKGIQRLYGLEEKGKALINRMNEIAGPWRPYRSIACFYLWRSLDAK